MRTGIVILTSALLAVPGLAATITTEHFGSMADVEALVTDGFEFHAPGDTQKLQLTRTDPLAQAEQPFGLWNNGVPHAFKVVFSPAGIAGISIDNVYTVETPVSINPATNGILVTAWTPAAGRAVAVEDLMITTSDLMMYPVPGLAAAPVPDYLLVNTDLNLAGGFILSGTVRFDWTGNLPPPDEQWFDVTTVVTPEPAGLGLALLGALVGLQRRR